MNTEDIYVLANLLQLQNIKNAGDWIQTSCPFKSLHPKQTDNHPSFGISVGLNSRYYCFTCQKKGMLAFLPTLLSFHTGQDFTEARAFIFSKNNFAYPDYKDITYYRNGDISVMDEKILKSFAKLPKAFIEMLGFTAETVKTYQLCYDIPSQRVIFPIRNTTGGLVGIRGRYVGVEITKAKYLSYTKMHPEQQDAKSYGIWYLMHEPLKENAPLVFVEGERDAIALRQSGKCNNVWASMGASFSKRQLETIINLRNKIVLFFDNDVAGKIATENIRRILGKLTKLYKVTNYYGCKDPAEVVKANKLNSVLQSIKPII